MQLNWLTLCESFKQYSQYGTDGFHVTPACGSDLFACILVHYPNTFLHNGPALIVSVCSVLIFCWPDKYCRCVYFGCCKINSLCTRLYCYIPFRGRGHFVCRIYNVEYVNIAVWHARSCKSNICICITHLYHVSYSSSCTVTTEMFYS